jgi:hypothetical protein
VSIQFTEPVQCHRADCRHDGGTELVPVTVYLLTGLPEQAGDVQLVVVPSKSQNEWDKWCVIELQTGYAVPDVFGRTRAEAVEWLVEKCDRVGRDKLARNRENVESYPLRYHERAQVYGAGDGELLAFPHHADVRFRQADEREQHNGRSFPADRTRREWVRSVAAGMLLRGLSRERAEVEATNRLIHDLHDEWIERMRWVI